MVLAFINTPVNEAASLVAQLQKLQDDTKGAVRSYVVFQGGRGTKADIEKLAAEKNISIPIAFLMGGENDPTWASYKLNPAAKTTILLSKGKVVTANFVNVDAKGFAPVAGAARKMLGAAE